MNWKGTIITYNVAMRLCDTQTVQQIFENQQIDDMHFVVVGLQEVAHVETLGTSQVTWARKIQKWMNRKGKMVLLAKNYQATNQVFVFIKKQIIGLVKRVDFRFAKNTLGGLTGHKGSIGVRIQLRSPFSLVFVDSHFVHDVMNYQKRIDQYNMNMNCCFWEDRSVRAAFWFGDLNFRVEEEADTVIRKIKNNTYNELLDSREQLKRAMIEKEAFDGFSEQPINFPPTYKVHVGSKEYDKKRTPSWCDRILYKGEGITGLSYESIEKALASDHLPVMAKFEIQMPVEPKTHWEVIFEHLPSWYTTIPLIGRFQIDADFYRESGSFRDWIGVFPATIDDCTSTTNWIYYATCYQQTIENEKYETCVFTDIPIGSYRLGYFSVYTNTIVGLSKIFQVLEPPNQ